jgi:predicted DNA-binding protein YlxM (UPF0122 family)
MASRSRGKYSNEVKAHCMSLYVDEGWTFERIATEKKISRPTLTAWAKKGDWYGLREKQKDFDEKLIEARNELLDEFLKSKDQNKIYAVEKIENIRRRRAGEEKPALQIQEALGIFVGVLKDDPELGPIIERRSEELYQSFTERMEAAIVDG